MSPVLDQQRWRLHLYCSLASPHREYTPQKMQQPRLMQNVDRWPQAHQSASSWPRYQGPQQPLGPGYCQRNHHGGYRPRETTLVQPLELDKRLACYLRRQRELAASRRERHCQRPSRPILTKVRALFDEAHVRSSPWATRLGQECQPFSSAPPDTALFDPSKVVIVSNGRCGSSCSLFSVSLNSRSSIAVAPISSCLRVDQHEEEGRCQDCRTWRQERCSAIVLWCCWWTVHRLCHYRYRDQGMHQSMHKVS